ncbi:MAG: hypothetical protein HC800_16445 [Phormidesmis sp. RL_2_1]|nr:hypothetical protein [Phormidesmis sp. RL_2_1]
MKFPYLTASLTCALMAAFLGVRNPAAAQTCTPLEVVAGGGDTEVTKTVTLPGLFFIDSNWDTDFAVNEPYDYYVTTITSLRGNPYDIDVFLKYPDESFDSAYSTRDISLEQNEPLTITAESRITTDPYQINVRVGGLDAEGNSYTASVSGCR